MDGERIVFTGESNRKTISSSLPAVTLMKRLRVPEKATTLSGAWRPRDPVDDDQGGARA